MPTDTERLDWLEKQSDGGPWWLEMGDHTISLHGEKLGDGPLTTVRAAIDAAMSREADDAAR